MTEETLSICEHCKSYENGKISRRIDDVEKGLENTSNQTKYNHINLVDACKRIELIEDKLKKLEEMAQERAHLINYKSYLALADRIEELESRLSNEEIMRKDLRDYCFDRLGSAINPPVKINIYGRIEKLESYLPAINELSNKESLNQEKIIELQTLISSWQLEESIKDKKLNSEINEIKSLIDIEKIKECIFNGAETHASILRCEARLKELEEWTRADEDKIYERLEKIESSKLTQELDPKVWKFVHERLDKLQQEMLETRIQFINQLAMNEKPNLCPKCNGNKVIYSTVTSSQENLFLGWKFDALGMGYKDCHICEGKGILWG